MATTKWTWVLGLALAASLASGTGALAAGAGSGSSSPDDDDALREARTLIPRSATRRRSGSSKRRRPSDPDDADVWNLVGFAYRKLERYEPAMEGYARALAIDPRHTEAIEYLGELYLALDDLARAEEQLARLGEICGSGCEEYEELKEAVEEYKAARGG